MAAATNPFREFAAGVGTLGRGFAFWRERPRVMALGLVPAAIVAVVILGAIALLGVFLDPITLALTSFADGWDRVWRDVLRVLLAVALVIATLALAARTFTAITLLVGTPFYDRIQAAVEEAAPPSDAAPLGFWATTRATGVLILQSLAASLVVLVVGLVPVVGSAIAAVLGLVLTAWALSRELTLGPFARRGLLGPARRAARRSRRARTFGFGLAVQLCYLVPFGAIVAMPAAVAGASLLARDLLDEPGAGTPAAVSGSEA